MIITIDGQEYEAYVDETKVEMLRLKMKDRYPTRKALADKAGFSDQTMRNMLTGGNVKLDTICSLAAALGRHPYDLLTIKGFAPPLRSTLMELIPPPPMATPAYGARPHAPAVSHWEAENEEARVAEPV